MWDNSFLPPHYQGVRITPGDEPVPDLRSTARTVRLAELEQLMLRDVDERHASRHADDVNLPARTSSFDVARGMMREAPEAFDVARESAATLAEYGVKPEDRKSFAWQCIVARRLVERGVRVVELVDTGSHDNWDAHGDMQQHRPKALRVDRALAAMIQDLKRRGLLERTLIVGCTEFGRTPWAAKANEKGAIIMPARSVAFWPEVACAAVWPMARPTNTAPRSSPIRYTSMTITPRSCTCWAWTTRGSPIATRDATSA